MSKTDFYESVRQKLHLVPVGTLFNNNNENIF